MINNIKEICREFDIDDSQNIDTIISLLRKQQAELHPDSNNTGETKDYIDRFSRLDEAIDYLRSYKIENSTKSNELSIISEITSLIKQIKEEDSIDKKIVLAEKRIQNAETAIEECSINIKKTINRKYLPFKITPAAVLAIVTFVWSFPSWLYEHPVLGELIKSSWDFEFFFTIIWLATISLSLLIYIFVFIGEKKEKRILDYANDSEFQHKVFEDFLANGTTEKSAFYKKDFMDFVKNRLFNFCKSKAYISDISCKIVDLILLTAIEKNIITKSKEPTWDDLYLINDSYNNI